MAYTERVHVAVTKRELAALKWVARRDLLQRYPNAKRAKRPGAGAVLRKMTIEQAVAEYEMAKSNAGSGVEL